MKITEDILYVGVNDHDIDLFEGQYVVPNGMAYNSYVILDDQVAVMDTVDARFAGQWLDNVKQALGQRKPAYLVVQHMEPDHSAQRGALHGGLSRRRGGGLVQGLCHDEAVFRHRFCRPPSGGGRRRHAVPGQPHAALCHGAHGALAGGAHDLRRERKGALFGRRLWKIRGARRAGGLGLRGAALLHRHCGEIRRAGTGCAAASWGKPSFRPSAPCTGRC